MGVRIDKPDLLEKLAKATYREMLRADALEQGVRACDALGGDTRLNGRGWQSAKNHAQNRIKPGLQEAIRKNRSAVRANRTLARALDECVDVDFIDEDSIQEAMTLLRRQQAEIGGIDDLIPEDAAGTIRPHLQNARRNAEQATEELNRKIERLHELDQATRNLYQDITGGNMIPIPDPDLLASKNRDEMIKAFEEQCGMSPEEAEKLADFTEKFRDYAEEHRGEKGWEDDRAIQWEYARILASIVYGSDEPTPSSAEWALSAGALSQTDLKDMLKKMGYSPSEADSFINSMLKMRKSGEKVDFLHVMGSEACMLHTGPGSWAYHAGTNLYGHYPGDWVPRAADYSKEAATWGGDVASGSMDTSDMDSDMDAININDRAARNPGLPLDQVTTQYYQDIAKDPAKRGNEFCAHYGGGDPVKGMRWLEQNGLNVATESPGERLLADGRASQQDQQSKMNEFLDHVNKVRHQRPTHGRHTR